MIATANIHDDTTYVMYIHNYSHIYRMGGARAAGEVCLQLLPSGASTEESPDRVKTRLLASTIG